MSPSRLLYAVLGVLQYSTAVIYCQVPGTGVLLHCGFSTVLFMSESIILYSSATLVVVSIHSEIRPTKTYIYKNTTTAVRSVSSILNCNTILQYCTVPRVLSIIEEILLETICEIETKISFERTKYL